jgi:hypothetical protein
MRKVGNAATNPRCIRELPKGRRSQKSGSKIIFHRKQGTGLVAGMRLADTVADEISSMFIFDALALIAAGFHEFIVWTSRILEGHHDALN